LCQNFFEEKFVYLAGRKTMGLKEEREQAAGRGRATGGNGAPRPRAAGRLFVFALIFSLALLPSLGMFFYHLYWLPGRGPATLQLLSASAGLSALAVLALGGLSALYYRRAEKELRESEEKYRAVFESTGTATIIIEEDTTISLANAEFCAVTGYSREEVEGRMSWQEFVGTEEDLQKMREYHRLRRLEPEAAPRTYESSFRDRRGNVRQSIVTVSLIPGTKQSVASFVDVTETKRAYDRLAALAQEEARLYEEARRRNRQLQALRSIDTAITASLDLRLTLDVILDQAVNSLGADAAAVLLFNQAAHRLEHAAGRGFSAAQTEQASLRLGEGGAGLAALQGETVVIPDLGKVEGACVRLSLLAIEGFRGYCAVPLVAKGQVKGVLEVFHRAPFEPDPEWLEFLETLARQAAVAIDSATLFAGLQRANRELTLAYDETIEALAYALDLRDRETEGHSRRVADLTVELARAYGMSEEELVHVRRGALLHDLGKLAVPDAVLHKPGPLTEEEWAVMRRHPVHAYEMLAPITHLRPALDIPYCHHEKWDGTGYPRGLKGKQIPLPARLFAVVDVWDALLSERPYRPPWTREKTLAYIRDQSGKHFDPEAVEAFLKVEGER
jgi:PAS domain S-box-containing protein